MKDMIKTIIGENFNTFVICSNPLFIKFIKIICVNVLAPLNFIPFKKKKHVD
jgi:hypothetical protein